LSASVQHKKSSFRRNDSAFRSRPSGLWGHTGSTLFTQFVTPVFYRIFVPPLPNPEENDE